MLAQHLLLSVKYQALSHAQDNPLLVSLIHL